MVVDTAPIKRRKMNQNKPELVMAWLLIIIIGLITCIIFPPAIFIIIFAWCVWVIIDERIKGKK